MFYYMDHEDHCLMVEIICKEEEGLATGRRIFDKERDPLFSVMLNRTQKIIHRSSSAKHQMLIQLLINSEPLF